MSIIDNRVRTQETLAEIRQKLAEVKATLDAADPDLKVTVKDLLSMHAHLNAVVEICLARIDADSEYIYGIRLALDAAQRGD